MVLLPIGAAAGPKLPLMRLGAALLAVLLGVASLSLTEMALIVRRAGNRTGRAGPVVSEEFLADLARVKPKNRQIYSGAAVQRADPHECVPRLLDLLEQASNCAALTNQESEPVYAFYLINPAVVIMQPLRAK